MPDENPVSKMTDEEFGQMIENIFGARDLILKQLGDRAVVDRTSTATRGSIDCPVCGGKLRFQYSHYNGHIHGHCETEDCMQWME